MSFIVKYKPNGRYIGSPDDHGVFWPQLARVTDAHVFPSRAEVKRIIRSLAPDDSPLSNLANYMIIRKR